MTPKPTELLTIPLDTIPLDAIDDGEIEAEGDEHASIDRLIAETDQGWDVDAQVLTLQKAAAARPDETSSRPPDVARPSGGFARKGPPPLPGGGPSSLAPLSGSTRSASDVSPIRVQTDMANPASLLDLLQARATVLQSAGDKVGLARVQIELAIATEIILGDEGRAATHAEAALKAAPDSSSAHNLLRRIRHGRGGLPAMLSHVDHEIAAATTEAHKVELLATKARLLDAVGGRGPEVVATWEQVLAYAPQHAGALKGLESELVSRSVATGATRREWEALSAHLVRMADAYESEAPLAAWIHVERAQVLERRLDRVDTARDALERAAQLDPGIGPVRDALVRHAAAQGDWGALVRLLDEEAMIETSAVRAARLELEAAAIAAWRLEDRRRACALLERAAARAPTVPSVDRRALDELVRLNEIDARWDEAARARRARLRFVTDPGAISYELRALAAAAESGGDLELAIADVQRAIAIDAADPTLVETLDRLFGAAGKQDPRIAMWLQEAARTGDAAARARALGRAAAICVEVGRPADAIRHLRSAWIAAPGDATVLDALARLLSPALSETRDQGARALVELYAQAAEQASDSGRQAAYLDKVALLWEELLGDPARAARAYEQVLSIDGDRRSAILGLQRTAARAGDKRTLARALLDEARLSEYASARAALQTRAAAALADGDPARARQLVRDVLAYDAGNVEARALETRLEEDVGRWELAVKSLRSRIDIAPTPADKVTLWLSLALMQQVRLRAPIDALASFEQARALDPAHPVPPEEIARIMEGHGDHRALRDAVERLAKHARSPEERARHIARAAEIDELCLGDDTSAMRTYRRALEELPEDELAAARLARVAARRARQGQGGELLELAALLAKRIERAPTPSAAQAMTFDLAALLVEIGQEPARATALLESALVERRDNVPALRSLEALRRRGSDAAPLARVLEAQGDELKDGRARVGALWSLAQLEEWKLPGGNPEATYAKILELDPSDPAALEALLRRDLPNAQQGDPQARKSAFTALRALVAFASDPDARIALQLRLAMLLEAAAADSPEQKVSQGLWREALDRYADALDLDPLSLAAATGVARLADKLHDPPRTIAAARSLAELAPDPRLRARFLIEGAERLLDHDVGETLGPRTERRREGTAMLEQALLADPDSIPAAARLATVLLEEKQGERLVTSFREALGRAKSPDALVMLGSEIARVARDELKDLTVAIDAMRRVRAAAPQHVPSLLTLAELCIAQRVWPEAVDALEAVVSTSREIGPKLTAFFALASIHEKVLMRPQEVDRALRAALALDPSNARALRGLLRRLSAEAAADTTEGEPGVRARREEMAELLGRLADAERDPDQKAALLLELADLHVRLLDGKKAERTLIEAIVSAPGNARAFAKLAGLFRRGDRTDDSGYARALASVISFGERLGRIDARWFAALGQLEVHALSRLRDGVTHLQRAVAIDPTLYETRFELAGAHAQMNAAGDAAQVLLAMIAPSAQPLLSIADPASGLVLLEKALTAERKNDEALVVSELRFLAGDLDDARRIWLGARRPPPLEAGNGVLDRTALVQQVLPVEGRHVLLEVAAAMAGVEGKILRADLQAMGVSSRDRIAPRSGHPTRVLLDRVMRELGVGEVELAIAPKGMRTRVLAQDCPWIVVPQSFVQLTESVQMAGLARAVARVAYGVPWLEELAPPQVEALLTAAARQVQKGYGSGDATLVAQHETSLARALGRKQKRLLEDLASHLTGAASRPPPIRDFVQALARAELRVAFLITGDLLAVLQDLRPLDAAIHAALETPGTRALGAVLEHALTGDLVRYALTPEATALRRRLGTAVRVEPRNVKSLPGS